MQVGHIFDKNGSDLESLMNIASEQGMDQMTCQGPVLCDYVQNATCTGKITDCLLSFSALHFFSHGYSSSS